MRTILTKTLAASLVLALALTLSCSSDDDKDNGNDPGNNSGGSGSGSYCELTFPATGVVSCLELPSNECSADLYSDYDYWKGFTYKKVDKCAEETPDVACFYGGSTKCGIISKSYCEILEKKPFKTIKECESYTPPAPTGILCLYNGQCGPATKAESCTQVGGVIVESCD